MKGDPLDLLPLLERKLLNLSEPSKEFEVPGYGMVRLPEPEALSPEEELLVDDMCRKEREALKLDGATGRPRELKSVVRDICLVHDVLERMDEGKHSNEAIFKHLSRIDPYTGSSPDYLANQFYKLRGDWRLRLLFEQVRLNAAVREYLQHKVPQPFQDMAKRN